MDYGQPIGLGKAGNNPYAMGSLGVNALSGGGGLLGLISQLLRPASQDPLQQQSFMQAAAARGVPVTSMPRTGGGLIPLALSKMGVINPNVTADPHTMDLENLVLQAKSQQRLTDVANYINAIVGAARYGGKGAAAQMAGALPRPDGLPSGFNIDTSQIMSPEQTAEEKQTAYLKYLTEKEKTDESRASAQQIMAQAAEERAQAYGEAQNRMLAQQTNIMDRQARSENLRKYGDMFVNLRSRAAQTLVAPADLDQINKAENYLLGEMNAGTDPNEAWIKAGMKFPVLQSESKPMQSAGTGSGGGIVGGLSDLWSKYMTTPGPTGATGTAPSPTGMRPTY